MRIRVEPLVVRSAELVACTWQNESEWCLNTSISLFEKTGAFGKQMRIKDECWIKQTLSLTTNQAVTSLLSLLYVRDITREIVA